MDKFNIGLDYNLEENLNEFVEDEARREALERQRERDGKKMTPAQKRDTLFEEIGTAVAADDMDVVKNILLENPKLDFTIGAFHHVKNAVMENFSTEWVNVFAGRKLPLSHYEMIQVLCRRRNDDMLDYVLNSNGDSPVKSAMGLFQETYKLFNPKLSTVRRELLNYYDQRFDELIEKSDTPNFYAETFGKHPSTVADCIKLYSNDLPQKQKDRLAALEQTANWNDVFKSIIEHKIKSSHMASVIAFCKAYPFANLKWNETLKNMSLQAQKYEDYIATHWGDQSKPIGQTELLTLSIEKMKSDSNQATHYARSYIQTFEAMKTTNLTEQHDRKLFTSLQLTEYQLFRHLGVGRHNFQKSYYFAGILPENCPKTFVHALLQEASSPVLVLLKNEKGQKMVEDALINDLQTLKKWADNADVDMIGKVLKSCKGLKTWTDEQGNTIAHYLTVFRREKTKTFGLMLARNNNDWYLQENAAGFSIKDLFKKNGATENMIIDMDKELLTRTLKDAGIRKSKKVEQSKKRKM